MTGILAFHNDNYGEMISRVSEINEQRKLRINLSPSDINETEQKALFSEWNEILPSLDVDYLKFHCAVPQLLLDSLWQNPVIEGLYIKSTNAKSLAKISKSVRMKHLHIGCARSIVDLEKLSSLSSLRTLHFEETHKISNYDFLGSFRYLEELEIEGGFSKKLVLGDLDQWVCKLENLRVLRIVSSSCSLPLVSSITQLKKLRTLLLPLDYQEEDFKIIKSSLPELEQDQVYFKNLRDRNMEIIRAKTRGTSA